MTEKEFEEFKETVAYDHLIKAVAIGMIAGCDAIIDLAEHTKKYASSNEFSIDDLIVKQIIEKIAEEK